MPPSDPPMVTSPFVQPVTSGATQATVTPSVLNPPIPQPSIPQAPQGEVATSEHPSVAMTTQAKKQTSKFTIFIVFLIIVVLLIWVGVGYLYFFPSAK